MVVVVVVVVGGDVFECCWVRFELMLSFAKSMGEEVLSTDTTPEVVITQS
jgi:hypothetical protein